MNLKKNKSNLLITKSKTKLNKTMTISESDLEKNIKKGIFVEVKNNN